jgi:RHS repeat-associated protein
MASSSNSLSREGMDEQNTATNGPAPMNVYLYAGDQIVENVTTGRFYYQDSLGNTSHVTDAVGNLLERYTYSAFGAPTFYNAGGTQIGASVYGIRHLFQGQLWTQETGLNDYRNRVELPVMGVFLQPDPIGFKGDAANIYRFCNNNAVNRTDPTGLYARGSGWSASDWVFFEQSQTAAADATEQALAKTERALANGGKAMEDAKAAYEKAFGVGSATRENLAQIAKTLQHMEEALRDDGSKGYYANAVYLGAKSMLPGKGGNAYSSDPKSIYINVEGAIFRDAGPWGSADQGRQWVMTHESSHNFGTEDRKGAGTSVRAYKYGSRAMQSAFNRLPNADPESALRNADTVTSFVYP